MSDVASKNKDTKKEVISPPPEEPKDPNEIRKTNESNYLQLNRELFYVQELLNSNTSWELEHKITTGSNLKLRGIFIEDDVSFNISNSFGTGGLSDTVLGSVSNAVGNLHKKITNWTPVTNSGGDIAGNLQQGVQKVADTLGGLLHNGQSFFRDDEGNSTLGDWNKGYDDLYNKTMNLFGEDFTASRVMNSKFISAVDLVKSFQGTDMKYSLPTLKCWIFHNSQQDETNVKSMVKAIINTCAGDVSDADGIIGLQYSPGDYRPEFTKVINQSKYHNGMGFHGTWNLTMGGYTIYNLVISNIDVSMSKFNAINHKGEDSGDPLYAELSITVEPASFISKRDMIDTLTRRRSTTNSITFHNYNPDTEESKKDPQTNSNKDKVSNGKTSTGGKKLDTETDEDKANREYIKSIINNPELTKNQKYNMLTEYEIMGSTKINPDGTVSRYTVDEAHREVFKDLDKYSGGTFGICQVDSSWGGLQHNYKVVDKYGKERDDLGFHTFTSASDSEKAQMVKEFENYIIIH